QRRPLLVLFLYVKPRILGPFDSPTTRAATDARPSSSGALTTVSPSTTSRGVKATSSPSALQSSSTSSRWPSATRSCLPPVLITAYMTPGGYRRVSSSTIPRPAQVGQVAENDSTRPSEMRLRVISTSPSSEMSKTCVLVL